MALRQFVKTGWPGEALPGIQSGGGVMRALTTGFNTVTAWTFALLVLFSTQWRLWLSLAAIKYLLG